MRTAASDGVNGLAGNNVAEASAFVGRKGKGENGGACNTNMFDAEFGAMDAVLPASLEKIDARTARRSFRCNLT